MTQPFEELIAQARPRLERAFLARYGTGLVEDVTAEVLAWAWEHRAEVEQANNPVGYLYRVGQSKARRLLRWRKSNIVLPSEHPGGGPLPAFEPGLDQALAALGDDQRTAVVLVHCFGWSQPQVG